MANKDWKRKKANDSTLRDKNGDKLPGRNPDAKPNRNSSNGKFEARKDSQPKGDAIPMWMRGDLQIVRDSVAMSYNTQLGTTVQTLDDTSGLAIACDGVASPGVMSIRVMPAIGYSGAMNDPANVSAGNQFAYMRTQQVRPSAYVAADFMVYNLAMDSLFSFYSFLTRAYGCLSTASVKNRYMPEVVIEAMGLDYEDFLMHLADFRWYINNVASRLTKFVVPKTSEYFQRHMWMYSGIYADSMSTKSQLYMFVPEFFYKFENGNEDYPGGHLIPVEFCRSGEATKLTFAEVRAKFESMLTAILASQDAATMSADIIRAWGLENALQVWQIPDDYVVLPVFAPEVLSQIQGATLVGYPVTETCVIAEDPSIDGGPLMCDPWFRNYSPGLGGKRLINQYTEEVDPAQSMLSTRLMAINTDELYEIGQSSRNWKSRLNFFGSEIATTATMFTLIHNVYITRTEVAHLMWDESGTEVDSFIPRLIGLQRFGQHPVTRLIRGVPNSPDLADYIYYGECTDLDNYTFVTEDVLEKAHVTTLLLQWNTPIIGAYAISSSNRT